MFSLKKKSIPIPKLYFTFNIISSTINLQIFYLHYYKNYYTVIIYNNSIIM